MWYSDIRLVRFYAFLQVVTVCTWAKDDQLPLGDYLSAPRQVSDKAFSYRSSFAHDAISVEQFSDIIRVESLSSLFDVPPNSFSLRGVHEAGRRCGSVATTDTEDFDERPAFPDTSDKETVVNLAKMTSDAYVLDPRQPDWLNTSLGYNFTKRFGWDRPGIRGHIFTTEDNSSAIVSFKGTTIDPREPLRHKDRFNDNLLFSCCCAGENPYYYWPVCDCKTGTNTCNATCVTQSVLQNETYYTSAMNVMYYWQKAFPDATFWVVGHSLGGALASLVGQTLGIPAITYEAPPERLPARRMGLFENRGTFLRHFGNTADPIFMGECHGAFTTCSFWGFSFESQCFTGRKCMYDTRKDKGWSSNIANHRINFVIENVLEAYDTVPLCESNDNCTDCQDWTFS